MASSSKLSTRPSGLETMSNVINGWFQLLTGYQLIILLHFNSHLNLKSPTYLPRTTLINNHDSHFFCLVSAPLSPHHCSTNLPTAHSSNDAVDAVGSQQVVKSIQLPPCSIRLWNDHRPHGEHLCPGLNHNHAQIAALPGGKNLRDMFGPRVMVSRMW